jgi:hypothetical protein
MPIALVIKSTQRTVRCRAPCRSPVASILACAT